jgi:D-sedoheptulose 7-phosphate isomerase
LRVAALEGNAEELEQAGAAMARSFANGGRLFTFGNGGSATDADATVDLFRDPPRGRSLPARSLVDDPAVLTALANDVGYELVFSRQIIAHARPGDIAVGFSTSGDSVNMLRAFEEAARRGLLTVGLCGYERAAMARSDAVHHCLVVPSESVHRIQEAQDALMLELWSIVQRHLEEGEVT